MQNLERETAPESVRFAMRKIEDLQSAEAAALSGATALSGVSSQLGSIKEILRQIHTVLISAEANWEDDFSAEMGALELEDVSKCTEMVIVTFLKEVQSIVPPHLTPPVFKEINTQPVNFFALHKLKGEISKIKSRIQKFNIKDLSEHSKKSIPQLPGQFRPDEIWLLGLELHQTCIVQKLVDPSLQTRSVVQVGGTQPFVKTALAQKIYQSTEVKTQFEVCFWLFPQIRLHSELDYDGFEHHTYLFKPINIMRKMLSKLEITNSFSIHEEDYHIISRLRSSLKERRCLVVIDNQWGELWTLVSAAFPDGNNGSRLLITNEENVHSDYIYELPFINKQDSLYLLQPLIKKNFLDDNTRSVFYNNYLLFNPSFEQTDRTLLDRGISEIRWCDSFYNSYRQFPSLLKTCIAYTAAVFPCGTIVHADSLIRLWILEGIIPQEEGRRVENIAGGYLDQLVQRGLLRIVEVYYHNQASRPIRSIILQPWLHNIFNEAAIHGSPFEERELPPVKVMLTVDAFDGFNPSNGYNADKPTNLHRLAFHLPYDSNPFSSFQEGSKLRGFNYPNLHSLFFFGSVPPMPSSQFSFVRVLAVFWAHIRFPKEDKPCWLDGLISLRYLGFVVCLVEGESLGKTLGRLGKLEVLDLSESIVSGLSEFIKNNTKVNVVGPVKEEFRGRFSPIPDMFQ